MGQVLRIMSYDRAANERMALSAWPLLTPNSTRNATSSAPPLHWYRLDDGVMGGRSETQHSMQEEVLHFQGTINTNGGGFASIRTKFRDTNEDDTTASLVLQPNEALQVRFRGDGKTYKVLLSDGSPSGPMARSPSWQVDLPTREPSSPGDIWEEATLQWNQFLPNFGGRKHDPVADRASGKHTFDPREMRELGFMLSLKLSNGTANPPSTFGEGIFDFSLQIHSIQVVALSSSEETNKQVGDTMNVVQEGEEL